MDTIIFRFPPINENIKIDDKKITFDQNPSPRLMKYGFNMMGEKLDMISLTSVPYYRAGLNFDFEKTDNNSFQKKAITAFKIKEFGQNFAEFWEILNLFGMLNTKQDIYASHDDTLKKIVDIYSKIGPKKTAHSVYGGKLDAKTKGKMTLVIYKYSDVDIDENAAIQIIMNHLPKLISSQKNGANMILQWFQIQTRTSAEIIYYLSSLYDVAYLVKASVTSDLSDSKYLVLSGLKKVMDPHLPKIPSNNYLISLGIHSIPEDFDMIIQCANSTFIPKKYKKYYQIKTYLNNKVYEGATYQNLIHDQDLNEKKWIETFTHISQSSMDEIFDKSTKTSKENCTDYSQLVDLLSV